MHFSTNRWPFWAAPGKNVTLALALCDIFDLRIKVLMMMALAPSRFSKRIVP
jgi:hypothetical protein